MIWGGLVLGGEDYVDICAHIILQICLYVEIYATNISLVSGQKIAFSPGYSNGHPHN